MIIMKDGDTAEVEIFGHKFYIIVERSGIAINKGGRSDNKCIAHLDGFYADPENAGELDGICDPIGNLEGKFQLLVYDGFGGNPSAKTVWHEDKVVTSIADGYVEVVEFEQYGRQYRETIMVSDHMEEE